MSKKRIRNIVGLMAVGLLGLVGFQLYWINNALSLQKEQFDYKVTDALQEVVRSLELQEILHLRREGLKARQQQRRLLAMGQLTRPDALANAQSGSAHRTNQSLSGQPGSARQKPRVAGLPRQNTRPRAKPTAPVVAQLTIERTLPGIALPDQLWPGLVVPPTDVLQQRIQVPVSAEQAAVVERYLQRQNELIAAGDVQAQIVQDQQFEQWVDQVLMGQLTELNKQSGHSAAGWADTLTMPGHRTRGSSTNRSPTDRSPTRPNAARPLIRPVKPALQQSAAKLTVERSATEQKAEAQSQMIKDVLKGLLLSDRPLEDRLDRLTLDTLLSQALQERGIEIPFDFGVRTAQSKQFADSVPGAAIRANRNGPVFLFTSNGTRPDQFELRGYKAALFPNNIQETGNYLFVNFPDQRGFILRRMAVTLAGSAVLILVIMACFYIAITTIVRQKKLADIKNDFINNMTHELKTPISTIALAVDMAQETLRPQPMTGLLPETSGHNSADPRLARYLSIVRDETRRLGTHVEKVLQMALLDRGQVKLALAPVNVHTVIEKVMNTLSLQIEQRDGIVDLEFDAGHEVVEADEVHLTNIVHNLVDNAIKYSPGPLWLKISTRSLPDGVAITVADHGLGMTRDQLSRIFEQFYRVPTGNRHDVKGFGLGLSYVKRMIDSHQGQITVESQLGVGSSFEITIPYRQAPGARNEERA